MCYCASAIVFAQTTIGTICIVKCCMHSGKVALTTCRVFFGHPSDAHDYRLLLLLHMIMVRSSPPPPFFFVNTYFLFLSSNFIGKDDLAFSPALSVEDSSDVALKYAGCMLQVRSINGYR